MQSNIYYYMNPTPVYDQGPTEGDLPWCLSRPGYHLHIHTNTNTQSYTPTGRPVLSSGGGGGLAAVSAGSTSGNLMFMLIPFSCSFCGVVGIGMGAMGVNIPDDICMASLSGVFGAYHL